MAFCTLARTRSDAPTVPWRGPFLKQSGETARLWRGGTRLEMLSMIPSIRVLALFGLMLWSTAHAGSQVDFTLQGVDGREYSLSDYRGKWVVVNYWATWCPPCLEEIPELVLFHENHKDKDAVVLGVNMEDIDREALVQFVEENFITYPVLRQEPGMQAVGPVPGLPTTYLVSPEGEVVGRKLGGITAEDIDSYIQEQSK